MSTLPSPEEEPIFDPSIWRYSIVFLGLRWAQSHGQSGHLKGDQLVQYITDAAEDKWGLLAQIVLDYHNLGSSESIGQAVSEMLEKHYLNASPEDKMTDFNDGINFSDRFALTRYPWQKYDPSIVLG